MSNASPHPIALELVELLARHQLHLVLVESCTGGTAASWLAGVPGVSKWWCGSLVAYRVASKCQWLEIPAELIARASDVSPQVTAAMAQSALNRTPEARLAAAVTGHLGPDAPAGKDGVIHTTVAWSDGSLISRAHQLTTTSRVARLEESAQRLLADARDAINERLVRRPAAD